MKNVEIERKWLIDRLPFDPEEYSCLVIEQAYLSVSPTVRVRRENEEYYLTYKGARGTDGNNDLSHSEYNLPLDRASYEHLKEKKDGRLIRKKRYLIPEKNGLTIELDIFDVPYEGLILAEVEFDSEEEALAYKAPDWFGKDVTGERQYKNAFMALRKEHNMKKAAVFLADGFEEIEGLTPVDMMRRAGVEVTTVSISGSCDIHGSHDIIIKADKLFEEVDYGEMDLLLLPGGGKGTENLESCEKLLEVLKKADSEKKLLAAICAAPRVLGKLGLLKGERAICFPGNEKFLEGAEIAAGEKVVISGRFITARGMGVSVEFGGAVLEALLGREKAEEILSKVQY